MKTLSVRGSAPYDKRQFPAKTSEYSNQCLTVVEQEEYGKWHFCNRTLLCLAVFRVAFGHLYESC